jgi:phenylalanyl-tRNA synthetase beta chain
LFEIANTFEASSASAQLPNEKTRLALVSDGDLRQLRGIVEGLITTLNPDAEIVLRSKELFWAETGAEIIADNLTFGTLGLVNKMVSDKLDFKDTQPVGAELDFELLVQLKSTEIQVKPIPRFPAIERDLSIILDESINWDDIVKTINASTSEQLKSVTYVETYRGKNIPSGKKSITLSLHFRDEETTLIHETVDNFEKAIVKNLEKNLGAELRTL